LIIQGFFLFIYKTFFLLKTLFFSQSHHFPTILIFLLAPAKSAYVHLLSPSLEESNNLYIEINPKIGILHLLFLPLAGFLSFIHIIGSYIY
jgi:hypothetical protein